MIALTLPVLPLAGALVIALSRSRPRILATLVLVAGVMSIVAMISTTAAEASFLDGYVRVDATTKLFAPVINVIFFAVTVYISARVSVDATVLGAGGDARRFAILALVFVAACNLVLLGSHLLLIWLALETTTLAAAPLIIRAESPASRLASWRYLLFSAVGLGLVLAGFVCLTRSMELDGQEPTLFLDAMSAAVATPANAWRDLGLGLVLLGLGTKLGLAPMYSWLPAAYDEAPPAVTALLGAVQFNCAVVLLFRVVAVYRPGSASLIATVLLTVGMVSMAVSTVSIIATRNFKRLLAYAAINHGGVIAIGIGLGQGASYGLLLYVLSNAFIKAILFLTAGKIEAHCGTKDTREIGGLVKDLPYSGLFLMVGTFALLGFPPFGSFLGELLILSALVKSDQLLVFGGFCVLVTMSFVATGRTIFPMIWGEPKVARPASRQSAMAVAPKLAFLAALVVLGVYIPPVLGTLLDAVASSLEGP